jgi:hypothetical protein
VGANGLFPEAIDAEFRDCREGGVSDCIIKGEDSGKWRVVSMELIGSWKQTFSANSLPEFFCKLFLDRVLLEVIYVDIAVE